MFKKYLRKSEFRMDLNSRHYGKDKKPHPAHITARYGNVFKANTITHARKIPYKGKTLKLNENSNKTRRNKNDIEARISPPFWQNKKYFGSTTLSNFRFSNYSKKKIKKFNKKYNQKRK